MVVLVLKRFVCTNKALLTKWLWRFGMERVSLWRRVIVARFREKSCWEANKVRGGHDCGIWKSIMAGKEDFWKCIKFQLRAGENIRF